jgi:hypothetical protein
MKRKRHTPEEIIKKLRVAATLLAGGQCVEEVCKRLDLSSIVRAGLGSRQ